MTVESRDVQVSRSSDGSMGGALLWLSLDDLAELGLDPDAEEVTYCVENGRLEIKSGGGRYG